MGFPEDVSVIAWGLGLERPTMIQFDISNIKELLGPAVSLKKVKDSAIFCLWLDIMYSIISFKLAFLDLGSL